MAEQYYPAIEAYRKIRFAEERHVAVYIYGATGFGKTRLWQECLKEREKVILSSVKEEWDLKEINELQSDQGAEDEDSICVVIDDLQLLASEKQRDQILNLIEREDLWLVMAGRMVTPQWMVSPIIKGKLIVISEEDLCLSTGDILKMAESKGVKLDRSLAQKITSDGQGNAFAALSMIHLIKEGNIPQEELTKKINQIFVSHLEQSIIPQWDVSLQEFMMQMSVVDSFSLPLAIMITGDDQAAVMIEKAFAAGNFLTREEKMYRIRPQLITALRNRALKLLGLNEYNRCRNHAGLYYETCNQYGMALSIYEKSGNKEGILRLLIRNARRHMGNGSYYELRSFYLALDEKEIEASPILMSTLSMIHSVMMNSEESERWYQKLRSYSISVKGGRKREANEQLLYLDIALPHRGIENLIDILKRTAELLITGGLNLAEFSITNNQPSTMNGGKDFCEWSKRDQFLAGAIGPMVEKLLGKAGRGLSHAALCESFYEKGGKDEEVLRRALLVQMAVDSGGKTEILFAAVGIQIRQNIRSGNIQNAIQLLESFEIRVRNENKTHLLPNIEALRCRIALVEGEEARAKEWMMDAPDENVEFWTLDRYRYLTKVRCYLAFGQDQQAIALLERLLYYAEVSHHHYIRMESKLLMAIALRREKREWKDILLEALNEIQEYEFVRIISEKGAGMVPLLKDVRKEYLAQKKADKEWFSVVLKETQDQAERYPGYLTSDAAKPEDFGETAMAVLKMQSEGKTMKEIAEVLILSERTVKYHCAENYRKLGAKGKVEAVQIARSLNLI